MSTYKINGGKFVSMEDLKSSLWELYKGKMSEEEFDEFRIVTLNTVNSGDFCILTNCGL